MRARGFTLIELLVGMTVSLLTVAAGVTLAGLFLLPARHADLPALTRMAPAW